MKLSKLRTEQKYMRFRQQLPQEQAAMRRRWAKHRKRDAAYRATQESFLREFDALCRKYSLNLQIRWRMIQQFRKRMESRDERKLATMRGGGWPLL